jgi:uncharacterized membrane protein YjgN (DUF898 family)
VHDIAAAAPSTQAAPPNASSADAAPAPAPPSAEPFHFTGKAGEYFGIWIVNLFLTIVTLGIYSAWAKVRKKRYFYGNTWVAGANFDFHGNPVAILKGRLLAFAAFAAYTLAGHYSPKVAALIALAIMPAVPWLLVRSFAFNALNSSYRNLRFHFRAGYADGLRAIWPLFLVPALVLVLPQIEPQAPPKEISAGLFVAALLPAIVLAVFYPYVVSRTNRLRIDHGRYGSAPFANSARTIQFYGIYAIAAILIFGAGLAMSVLAGVIFGFFAKSMETAPVLALWLLPAVYLVAFAVVFAFTRSRVANVVFNHTRLAGRVRFTSKLRARALARIYITNALAIVASVGLLIPWAAIRTARYRADCLWLECSGGLEAFAADVASHVSATGEEMGDMFDVDLSL